jgi:plastocyanin
MSKKDRKRRETTRRQKEQRQAKAAAAGEDAAEGVDEPDDAAPEDDAAAIKRRAEQKREYEKRKRAKARGGQSLAPYFWGGGIAAAIAVAVVGGFLLLSGGGGDDSPDATPIVTPDSRVAGLPIDVTIEVDTDDDGQNINPRFIPNAISANAGQVVEIVLSNVGSVAHNLRLAGIDDEYDTRDDWITDPLALFSGDTGTVVVQLDDPGVYAFRCDFHATLQTGTFTVR